MTLSDHLKTVREKHPGSATAQSSSKHKVRSVPGIPGQQGGARGAELVPTGVDKGEKVGEVTGAPSCIGPSKGNCLLLSV